MNTSLTLLKKEIPYGCVLRYTKCFEKGNIMIKRIVKKPNTEMVEEH